MTGINQEWIDRKIWRDHILAVACLIFCSLIYLSPLILHFETSIPGKPELTDVTEYIWSVGWVRYALDHNASLAATDFLFVPFGADLRLDTQQLLQSLIAYPFTNILGVIGAYKLVLIMSFVLNGILAYGFVYSIVRHSQAALISAVCLMLSGALVWHFGVGRLALPALWVIIANVWCLKNLLENPKWMTGIGLGLLLSAATFTDLQILLFSLIWIVLYLLYDTVGRRGFAHSKISALGVALFVWGAPFAFRYAPAFVSAADSGYPIPRLIDMAYYSFQFSDFVNPQMIPYIFGFDFLLGGVTAVLIFRWQGEYRFWLIASLVFLFFTLGPYLKPYENIHLPYSLISLWEPAMQFRTPYRLVIPGLLGWAVTLGFVLIKILPKIRGLKSGWAVVLLFVGARLWYTMVSFPFETQTYPQYAFYKFVAEEPGDFAILEVPFGIRSGLERIGKGGERFQYYQHIHNKRLLNGSVSRLPSSVFEFYRSHPALLFFADETIAKDDLLEKDFAGVLEWSNIRYVLVHRLFLPADDDGEIESFLNAQPQLELFMMENDLIVYRVQP